MAGGLLDGFEVEAVVLGEALVLGREAIRAWIKPIMDRYGELYTVYEWHMVEPSGRAVVYMQNRRDHPSGSGVIDFPGITILQYAGGGLDWGSGPDWTRGAASYWERHPKRD